ncbi:MAG: hypothetical protein F4109_01195 [Gammaproteobacteria bacterium]|nr:hypothetical protein [Gammaproteobacteria bacterium]MYD02029.1 hypothetical protein [Gammaproteobacteria bacterium]MYI24040.1 hypothetical protein [Gammaproteobacteria bacterium]
MTDIVDTKTRSKMMASIRGRDTAPELIVRCIAHRMGLRFCLQRKEQRPFPCLCRRLTCSDHSRRLPMLRETLAISPHLSLVTLRFPSPSCPACWEQNHDQRTEFRSYRQ